MAIYTINYQVPDNVPADLVYDFDLFQPAPPGSDFFQALYDLKQAAPAIFWTRNNDGHWLVTDSELAVEVLTDSERFSNRNYVVPKQAKPPQAFIPVNLDPPEHAKYRMPLSAALSPATIQKKTEKVRELAIQLIKDLKPKGRCEFMTDFAFQLPVIVFMQLVDLPESERLRLVAEVNQILKPGSDKNQLIGKLAQYLLPIVQQRYKDPQEDLISLLGQVVIDGERISIENLTNMCTLLVIGGLDSMANTLGFFARFLADNRAHRHQLIDEPELVAGAVDELLRRFPTTIAGLGRYCAADTTLGGVLMREGDIVMTPPAMINFDERLYPDPLTVDFSRNIQRVATFGQGRHFCAGANLARMELKIFLEEWLAHIPEFQCAGGSLVTEPGFNIAYQQLPLQW